MNDYYWNEYKNILLDEFHLIDTLKYQQRTIDKKSSKKNLKELSDILGLDVVKHSDTRLKTYHLDKLPKNIKKIFITLKKSYNDFDYKVSMPIIALLERKGILDEGSYSFDFKNNLLIMYESDIKKVKQVVDNFTVLGFFLNIEDAICLYGKKAYASGIKEIGYISKTIQLMINKETNIKLVDNIVPEQQLTNSLGINVRKCLLMETFTIEEKN